MRKYRALALLLPRILLLGSCAGQGKPIAYETEHNHVFGYWYDSTEEGTQVRYCKICQLEQTRKKP